MPCFGTLRRVALAITDVSEELSASIRVSRIDDCHTYDGDAKFLRNVGS
jgi:hypothetical protein